MNKELSRYHATQGIPSRHSEFVLSSVGNKGRAKKKKVTIKDFKEVKKLIGFKTVLDKVSTKTGSESA